MTKRINLLAKGNLDVRDTLLALRLNGVVHWNGINEVLRHDQSEFRVRVRHELWTRSDALLRNPAEPPVSLDVWRNLNWGNYSLASQFSHLYLAQDFDAYVLSIMPDVCDRLYRHKREGYLIHTDQHRLWSGDAQMWLAHDFEALGLISYAESMANIHELVSKIREISDAPILIYNVSSVMPSESIHCWEGVGETFSTRVKLFNMGLIDVSRDLGISIVDVDRIVALLGASLSKIDQIHLAPNACEAVAKEVVRILSDFELFSIQ
jgi:hypothetical protein